MKNIIGSLLTILGAVITILSLIVKIKGQMAVSIIGVVDGPTSTFVAGKVGGGSVFVEIFIGIALFVAGIFILKNKR
jgi:oxaloacetate decarboxylase beta subunit